MPIMTEILRQVAAVVVQTSLDPEFAYYLMDLREAFYELLTAILQTTSPGQPDCLIHHLSCLNYPQQT